MNPNLFSPDLETRYQATMAGDPSEYCQRWPRACYGAANGWLMLIGPSPGKADSTQNAWPGGPNRPLDSGVSIGPSAGRISFDTGRGRNSRWDRLRQAALGYNESEQALKRADALTTLANLDWGNNADHRCIPDAYLAMGCADVFEVMKQSKPRVIVALVWKVWNILIPFLEQSQTVFSDYPSVAKSDCRLLRLPGTEAPTLILRSPQHPSMPFFTKTHTEQIHSEVEHFLTQSAQPLA